MPPDRDADFRQLTQRPHLFRREGGGASRIVGWLAGEATHGTIWKAGLPKTMRKEPAHA